MSLSISEEALPPGFCTASAVSVGPFIRTGTFVRGQRVQVSVAWIRSIADELGLVDERVADDAIAVADGYLEELEALRTRVERFDEDVANVGEALSAFAEQFANVTDLKSALARALDTVRELSAKVDALEAPDALEGES